MPPRCGKAWALRRSPVGCRHMRRAAPDLGSFRRGKITAVQQPFLAAGPGFRQAPPCRRLAGHLSHYRLRSVAVAKRSEGDRPAWDLHRRDTMLPVGPHLVLQMIDRAGREREREAREFLALLAAKAHRRRGAERDADNMLEHRPVAMPPDTGTRAVGEDRKSTRLHSSQ